MAQTGTVNSGEIFNETVSLGGGKKYSAPFQNFRSGGFRIASVVNDPTGDLECTYTLEGWDGELNDWVEEPLAGFERHPVGVAIKTTDTFKTTHAEKYRVGIDPSAPVTS
jgi:hypothetical protein